MEHSIQIRDLTFDPPYSSAAGQCKAAPVTQIGREQLNKWHWATHECSCGVKEVGEGLGGRKEKKKGGGERLTKGGRRDKEHEVGLDRTMGPPCDTRAFFQAEGPSICRAKCSRVTE